MIQKELIDILACPACDERPPVKPSENGEFLVCVNCGRRYPIRDDVPIMLVDQALPPEKVSDQNKTASVEPADQARLRFAPSPTGNVHIGNIRAAIFNWLYARHGRGDRESVAGDGMDAAGLRRRTIVSKHSKRGAFGGGRTVIAARPRLSRRQGRR